MSLNLMTGYAGEPHITSADDGAVNAAIYGAEKYVLNTGQKFAYELISNNLIKIKDGYAMNQGRKIGQAVNDYEELTIDNGLQGVKRSDIIAIRYSKNIDTGIESAEFVVIKGTSGDTYKDPALETGNIIQGDSVDDLPLYRVKIDGLSIATVEPMFNMLMSMQEMQDEIASNARAIDSLNSNLSDKISKMYGMKSIFVFTTHNIDANADVEVLIEDDIWNNFFGTGYPRQNDVNIYIPITARPLTTWNTIPIIQYDNSTPKWMIHNIGTSGGLIEVQWLITYFEK